MEKINTEIIENIEKAENNRKKLVVVDDNSTNLTACKHMLEPQYEVYTALSVSEMFKVLENVMPDMCLLDVEMPGTNGYEAIQMLKSNDAYKNIPTIFLTIKNDVQSEMKGFNLGAIDYIHKPFNKKLLLRRIELHLSVIDYQRELKKAADEAHATSLAKSEFLSNMSHEIRTPLNAIIGMAKIGNSAEDIKRKDYAFEKISDSSEHLLGIINDILDISKIEAKKFELSYEAFDFEKMLQKVVNMNKLRLEEKKQRLSLYIAKNMPQSLVGDEQRLVQAITNLLSNAIKFTPAEKTIRIEVHLLEQKGDLCILKFSIIDSGIGISEEQQSRLFNSFQQANSNITRKFGGTGLGLNITKNIIELMGGKIWVESKLGAGAKFTFTIQAKRGDSPDFSPVLPGPDFSGIKILVADDDGEVLERFLNIAECLNVCCDTAACGGEALEHIKSGVPYDMFFINWEMGDVDGNELSRQIIAHNERIPEIVMLLESEFADFEQKAKTLGVTGFLNKPLFVSSVAECIKKSIAANIGSAGGSLLGDIDSFEGHHILLVEDIEINREIVLSMLEPTLVGVDIAENGIEAVEAVKSSPEKYDMIFMDVKMPEMDGHEATRRIRALKIPKAKKIPIIAMTANVFREDIEKCIEAGMNDHIGKPLSSDEVIEKLKRNLRPNLGESDTGDLASETETIYEIAWDDSLSLGDEYIDGQHKQLFGMAKGLIDASAFGAQAKNCDEVLDFLLNYAESHLSDEEKLQIRCRYPEYKKHKQLHDEFRVEVKKLLQRRKADDPAMELREEINIFVVKWLINHVQFEDKKISAYIKVRRDAAW